MNTSSKKIFIYRDYGQFIEAPILLKKYLESFPHLQNFQIEYTDATSIIHLDHLTMDCVAALFMPGAHSRGYACKLDGAGNSKIAEFIKGGGMYFGFCGGAYYACKKTVFRGKDFSITKSNELDLCNGFAIGSIPELTDGNYFDETVFSSNAVQLDFYNGQTSFSYYNGGCYFDIKNDSGIQIIAQYSKIKKPAVISFPYQYGNVFLSGVHPEYTIHALKHLHANKTGKELKKFQSILDKMEKNPPDDIFGMILGQILCQNPGDNRR